MRVAGCGGLGALGAEDRDVVGGGAAFAVGGDLGLESCGQGVGGEGGAREEGEEGVQAELVARGVHGFGDAVGVNEDVVAGGELKGGLGFFAGDGFPRDAERGAVGAEV